MPQPLSQLPHVKAYSLQSGLACDARPEHAMLALKIILASSWAELLLAQIVLCLAPQVADRVAKVLVSHQSDAKKSPHSKPS